MQLKNKIALVTGASSGIGKAIAEKFASEGALVILTSRNLDRLKEVENSIKKNNGKADSIVMDVTDREQVKNAVLGIIEKYKKIDVLVNNAGIARWGPIEDVSYEDFDEQIKFNLTGSFNTIKEIAPIMIEQKSGSIVNIITSTVKKTKSGRVAYAASKYGQAGLSNAVHEDLKEKGISVVAVYPGKTNTPIHDPGMSKDDPQREKMLKPEQVAEVVLEAALISAKEDVKELVVSS
ncbi:beta-ketoacyl-ACP reductase [archaeon]|jgi:3-oxoacyl-[acyl-carrier protein] reductase|nr:beta-ketoacyl-ACP reductase [archaeon]MDP6547752.1 SDR family oxidoreductase [Candidatus Woesearchaeota archaeon]|tara:strand:- start:46778 stop:47485 length:708 start_codon:yes stop_codon:yes gene_type:complete